MRRAHSAARAEDALEIGGCDDPGHRLDRGLAPRHEPREAVASDGQALPTLGAPGVDDGTAAARLHADEKAVGAGATGLRGLVRAFHVVFPARERRSEA